MENIIKQGYLKKSRPTAPGSNPANSFLQLFEPTRWFVFGLRNRKPYLEYYEKEQHAFTAQPINSFDLFTCTKVTYTLGRNNRNWTFCLFLRDRILELTADTRDVMLSWCRTFEHTLQSYGALKHVPSEHIYSDYPVKYKPRRSSPPPTDDRSTPTPPPLEPAPPIPRERLSASDISLKGQNSTAVSEYYNSAGWTTAEKDSEHSEPDTSEDDFVNEDFFKEKRLEAVASQTLKLASRSENPLALQSGLAATLPCRTFSLPLEEPNDTPELPIRRNNPAKNEPSELKYSQVIKYKSNPEMNSEGIYESEFDDNNRNTLVVDDTTDEAVYETAFDVKDTRPLVQQTSSSIELPKRKSKFEDLERIAETRSCQNGMEENLYSEFNSVISPPLNGEVKHFEFEGEKISGETKVDLENNNTKIENPYDNFVTKLETLVMNKGDNPESVDSSGISGVNSYVELSYDSSKHSPVKPPRRSSKNIPQKEGVYENLPVSESDSKPLEVPQTEQPKTQCVREQKEHQKTQCVKEKKEQPKTQCVRENIYDFGKCTAPPKTSDNSTLYENVNSDKILQKPVEEQKRKHSVPTPLNLDLVEHKASTPSSPDTPRRTPTNIDPFSTKSCLVDLPPSPSSPLTPVSDKNLDFPSVNKSVVDVAYIRQSCPSPKHSRESSHSPKIRHSDGVPLSSQIIPKLPPPLLDSSNKKNASKPPAQERPRSLEMTLTHDNATSSQPVRKNTGEQLYSPVMNRNWFGSQPMPGTKPLSMMASKSVTNILTQPLSETDTSYEVPKRTQSVIQRESNKSVIKHEPQPTFIGRSFVANGGSSSPSHDGFQFNVSPNHSSDDEDDETHDYEDATMRHVEPPLPPRRNKPSATSRSQSVYVPCNINQDPSRVIVRQTSLRERQRITPSPGLVTVLPLKQSEIDILREEQQSHGIIVKITPAACQKIALVDSFNGVWIIGWDFKHYPRLAESIHIGDEVTKINEIRVTSAHMAKKTLKGCNTDQVDLVIKRLPYAHVMAIRRNQSGEKLGIQRQGGTAEITYVDPSGLAAQHGLSRHAKCVDVNGTCNWWITEINNRPLNLSFKGDEIEFKLNAVGKDISIVVHPSDFIKELKRQLKKIRNFKDFLALY